MSQERRHEIWNHQDVCIKIRGEEIDVPYRNTLDTDKNFKRKIYTHSRDLATCFFICELFVLSFLQRVTHTRARALTQYTEIIFVKQASTTFCHYVINTVLRIIRKNSQDRSFIFSIFIYHFACNSVRTTVYLNHFLNEAKENHDRLE